MKIHLDYLEQKVEDLENLTDHLEKEKSAIESVILNVNFQKYKIAESDLQLIKSNQKKELELKQEEYNQLM